MEGTGAHGQSAQRRKQRPGVARPESDESTGAATRDTAEDRETRRNVDRSSPRSSGTSRRRYRRDDDLQSSDYRPTQLPFDTALRAREVARPGPSDLAEAAAELTLVRRHYVPRSEHP